MEDLNPNIFFAEDLTTVDSLSDLLKANVPAIWLCIPPERKALTGITEVGAPVHPGNFDIDRINEGQIESSGWAIVSIPKVAYYRDFFAVNKEGEILILTPPWRHKWMVDHFGDDLKVIRERLFHSSAYKICEQIAKSESTLGAEMKVEDPAITFTGHVHGHWLCEQLLPLGVWFHIQYFPKIVSMWLKGYQSDLLKLLNYPGSSIEVSSPILFFEKLLLPIPWSYTESRKETLVGIRNVETGTKLFNKNEMWWRGFGTVLLDKIRTVGSITNKTVYDSARIYVRRDKQSIHSICLNEDSVCILLEKYGFLIIDPSTLSGHDEASVFHRAAVVVGTSGGGMDNIVYCKPNTDIVLLCGEDSFRDNYTAISAFGRLNLIRIRSPQLCSIDSWYLGSCSPYVVDLEVLERIILKLPPIQ